MRARSTSTATASTPAAADFPRNGRCDLLVVGGGTAGLVAAQTAVRFGATVVLVERDRTGGDCLWTGCVPSKALLSAAHTRADALRANGHGLIAEVEVDFAAIMRQVQQAIRTIEPVDSPETLCAAGIIVIGSGARFAGPDSAVIDGRVLRFRAAVIATGASPIVPDIPGLAQADPQTSETIWSLTELPARLLIVGGGAIGCELGQAFARLGSVVTIVESEPRVLPAENLDAANILTVALQADGVQLRTGHQLVEVERAAVGWQGRLDDGSVVEFDRVLLAVGRRPRTKDLGLTQADVAVDDRGYVRVDDHLQTSNKRIWAAGDVTPLPAFTHVAGVHGSLAARNALLGLRSRIDPDAIPRVVFTRPEVAAVGATNAVGAAGTVAAGGATETRGAAGKGRRSLTLQHHELDRAIADRRPDGFTRLTIDRRGRVLGGLIVSPRAGESIAEVVLAVQQGLRARDLAAVMHAYPTYSEGVWKAALLDVDTRLRGPVVRRAIGLLLRLRRWRLDR